MNKLKHTGIKISDYPSSITNVKDYPHKLEHNHYFISYAPTYFGTSTINKNYKIPLNMLRQDQKFYIGLNNAKGDWQNLLNIWSGYWYNEDRTESYVYEWSHEERGSNDYIKNKFGLESDEDKIDRIFFIKDAPIPMEESHIDPNPATNKFVNKKYIDDRFNGVRKLTAVEGILSIRPYTCVYEYATTPTEINIIDTDFLQDGRRVADCLQNNILTFILKFPVSDSDNLTLIANGKDNVKWSYPSELSDILHAARSNNYSDVWLECFAGYKNGELCIRCSNALNPMPGGEKQLVTTDTIQSGNYNVPTSNAVYHFVKDELSTINSKVEEGDFISVTNNNVVSVKTSTTITNDGSTLPTTQAVYNELNTRFESLNSNESSNGITVTQENGVITNVTVNSATVDSNGNITGETKNNVIIGSEVQKIIDSISAKFADFGFTYQISAYLPTDPGPKYKNHILLVPDTTVTTDNEYNEYICVNKPKGWSWEQIGSTKIDLSDYVTNDKFDAKVKEIMDAINAIDTKVEYTYNGINGFTQKMRFLGKYVQLVEHDGFIDLIFGPNNNPPFFSSLSSPTTSARYVYKPVNGSYPFPTNQEGNVIYTHCSPNTSNQVIRLMGTDTKNNIVENLCSSKDFTLTCNVNCESGKVIEVKLENIDGSQSSYEVSDSTGAVTITLSDVVKNGYDDDGTPGYIRYKGKITVNQSKVAPSGDWYTLSVNDGGTTKSSVQIFAYKPVSNNQYPNFATGNYSNNSTRTVSGITYAASGTLTARVNDIAGTQNQVTEDLNRLKLSVKDTNNKIVFDKTSKIYTTDNLRLDRGNNDSDNAVYYMVEDFTTTVTTKDNAVTKLNATVTAQAGQQSGFNTGSEKSITSTSDTEPSYIWTKPNNTTDTELISYFTEDGSFRKLGVIESNKLKLISGGSYNSETKLYATNYNNQLMIQGGKLKYPKSDITQEYKDLSGTRYYVRAIQFAGTGRIYTFNIKFSSGLGNTFPTGIRMYLAKDQESELQELTAAQNQGLNGCSVSDNPSNGAWTVAPDRKFEVRGGTTYYFIIEYNSTSAFLATELGTLTITY